ncbi:Coenzyme A biosynthesis bifunctional protein CoaBC [Campylobacter majalis]|uniref:Coenzyme A biosynthesis bifunctional protein CoaBC n=1 Tax=Campylobacter majalis TaxID=2790656 RepID=A0ABM8Q8A6_9BACT|nr:bifunctional phosphopantothenoylcysteine decarboxylase/phosphopantothenate--cysteine ligase CoaBC [Campylobacter majalis]CAD7289205.1 Coenzyme A biosynthesis bifunctional protein CoaBC [Campylobacter majalis]
MLKDKKILLAVCGSVSFYKAYEILSHLKKLGADVRVMLSDGALKFTNPLSFEALTNHEILSSVNEKWQEKLSHIEYAKCDLVLIAPASANTINKYANGIADTVFLQTLIASDAPVIIAPAANNKMLEHFTTQKSIEILKQNGVSVIEPLTKILACGDLGKGALAEPKRIIYEVKKALSKQTLIGKKVVITGGGTTEKIDDVRAITNHSSGKMSKALADAFYYAGADVTLLSHVSYEALPYPCHNFHDTKDLLDLCKQKCKDADLLIMSAAVSDYVSANDFNGKLKKSDLGEKWGLWLVKNIDILSELKAYKCKKIGFKLETDKNTAISDAKATLNNKNLDAICLNIMSDSVIFGADMNEITFITKNSQTLLSHDTKENLAKKIVELSGNL